MSAHVELLGYCGSAREKIVYFNCVAIIIVQSITAIPLRSILFSVILRIVRSVFYSIADVWNYR